MTLVSRPVLGNNLQCTTPSGFASMPSSRDGKTKTCLGRTPGFWKQEQKFNQWPSPPYFPVSSTQKNGHKATTFNSVFTAKPSPYSASTTFLEVLKTEDMGFGGPPHNVARHCVAAILNAAKGWTPVLSEGDVKNIWREYMMTGGGTIGYFEPTAGIKWYQQQIVAYLTSTMTL